MEQKPPKPMTPFDRMTTPHRLYMLKLMLPYTPPSIQHMLAIYIKFSELEYTFRHFQNLTRRELDTNFFSEIKPYMEPEEQEMMEQMEDMMNMMEMVQMMNPDGQEMFDLYNSMFGNGPDKQEGDVTHERMDE